MDGRVKGDLGSGVPAGTDVIDGADVAAGKADAWTRVKHQSVGWVNSGQGEEGSWWYQGRIDSGQG